MARHIFTPEQDEWLKENIERCDSYAHLSEMFNERFSVSVGKYSVSDRCIKRLNIHRNANSGVFKKGEQNATMYKIGDERVFDGYVWVKVNDVQHKGKVSSKMFMENWMPKHRYVYEKHYGKIPDGWIVVFLDTNKSNFDINNLYCMPRKINAVMNKNKWFSSDPEITLTAIKWCELWFALKDKR